MREHCGRDLEVAIDLAGYGNNKHGGCRIVVLVCLSWKCAYALVLDGYAWSRFHNKGCTWDFQLVFGPILACAPAIAGKGGCGIPGCRVHDGFGEMSREEFIVTYDQVVIINACLEPKYVESVRKFKINSK